jgi:hypothetical protein
MPNACTPNENTAFVTVPLPVTADNCGVATVINNYNNTNNASDEYPIGTTPVSWVVTDVNGRTAYCVMNITVIKCCLAESGTVAVNDHICPGGTITSTLQGNNISAGYQTLFIVTNTTNGTIVAINNTGSFPTLGAGLAAGNYLMYAYNVKTATALPNPQPAVGMPISQIGSVFMGCYDLSLMGVPFTVPAPFPLVALTNTVSEGNNGGATPFYYDIVELTVAGGTQPYSFNWNNAGYVRYDIQYEMVDTNGDNVADMPGATITIFYADNATWNVSVSDAYGCTANSIQFDNIPVDIDLFLDIANYETTTDNGTNSGGVDITVSAGAGCAPYSYAWSGPDGYTSTNEDLDHVPFGWYSVTVSCGDGSQSTQGWYWVPRSRRGRSKTEGMSESISAYPNPMQNKAMVEFYVNQTGNTQIAVLSADGKQVAVLYHDIANADEVYEVPFNAGNLPAGMYTIVMTTELGSVQHAKVIINK